MMQFGSKVRLKKGFTVGVVTFECGDILAVANYIHKIAVWLKAKNVNDLIKIN